jgi:hypothetical protein
MRSATSTGALKAGVSPKVVSERIGHADVGFFLQTYAHALGNDDRDAAEQAAAFLIGNNGWDPADSRRRRTLARRFAAPQIILLQGESTACCFVDSEGYPSISYCSVGYWPVARGGAL